MLERSRVHASTGALICFEKSLTMALFADILANNTGRILSVFKSFLFAILTSCGKTSRTGLPKLGDVRHHFEIRVLVP